MIRREMSALGSASLFALALAGATLPLGAQVERTPPAPAQPPTGWFGVRISDQAMITDRGDAFFDSYPVVTSVDSGSPAAKAGVKSGDVLLTFNSHDMRGASVELAKWLKVGAPFVLKIRRNEATRVVRGTLARRPDDWEQNLRVELTMPEIMEHERGSMSRVPMQRVQVRERMPAPNPMSMVLPPALGYGTSVYPFAGAEFTELNNDLSDALGVKAEGVFVTNVVEGSPARAAGLRGGDIILKADSIRVETPIDLVRAIRSADDTDRRVVLQIIRKHKPQTLILGW